MADIRPEDRGDIGEADFFKFCKQVGLVANKSTDDKKGWDYEVEHRSHNTINYTNRSAPVYRIQVKATAQDKNSVLVTYKNLLDLVDYPGASFIFFIKYDPKPQVDAYIDACLLHFDEDLARQILGEIRNKDLNSGDPALDTEKKTIKFKDSDRIEPLNGEGLKKAFEAAIGGDYLKYIARKASYLDRLQKEGRTKSFTFALHDKEDLQSLIDACLGYGSKFTADVESFNAPYGQSDRQPYNVTEGIQTTLSPVDTERPKVSAFLRNSQFGKEFRFDGIMYGLPEELRMGVPEELQRFRIKTNLFDILYHFEPARFTLEFRDIFSTPAELREIYNAFSFVKGTQNSDGTRLRIKYSEPGGKEPNELEINLGPTSFEWPTDFEPIFEALEATYLKCRNLNIDDKKLSLENIRENLGNYQMLQCAGRTYEQALEFEEFKYNSSKASGNAVIFPSVIRFDDIAAVFVAAFFGEAKRVREDSFSAKFVRSEWLSENIVRDINAAENLAEAEVARFRSELSNKGFEVL